MKGNETLFETKDMSDGMRMSIEIFKATDFFKEKVDKLYICPDDPCLLCFSAKEGYSRDEIDAAYEALPKGCGIVIADGASAEFPLIAVQ